MINYIGFIVIAFFVNLLGGLFVIYFKSKIKYLFFLSAIALISVSLFDLIPEVSEMFKEAGKGFPWYLILIGFIFYFLISKIPSFGHHHKHDEPKHLHSDFKAGGIVIHSIVDGIAIGAALTSSLSLGVAVLFASLIHRFNDGMSIVSIIYGEENNFKKAIKYLLVDCLAPTVGVIISIIFTVEEADLGYVIGLLAGAFLYIGLIELLPEAVKKFVKNKH